jgi:hypothetical protein
MSYSKEALDDFMATYERNAVDSTPSAVLLQFAENFLAAGPAGPVLVPAAAFAQHLPARKQSFDKAGLQSSKLTSRRDLRLGDRYVLVDTDWQMDFAPADMPHATLTAKSSFLVDMGQAKPKILAYISHQDIFQLMQERGLIARAS